MKNTLFALALLIIIALSGFSQTFYIKLGAGYALGTGTALLSSTLDSTNAEGHYGSYGEGILPALTVGYMFNNNIGIEVSGSYLIGRKHEHDHTSSGITENHKQWGEGIIISPAVVVQAPMKNHSYYARFGGSLGIVKVKEEETQTGTEAELGVNKFETSGNLAIGINGAFGVSFKAGKMMNIFVEVFGTGMNYGPKQRENTEAFTGETPEPVLHFEESFDPNTANTVLTPRLPLSNYGMTLGLSLNFGKTMKKK